jgi:Bifunctional DNA primase/polymerase, N-terminal/Primase C terminal 1 (PriCT-1)
MSAQLQAAHWCVDLGLGVFPLHYIVEIDGQLHCSCGDVNCGNPGKHPYSRHAPRGCYSATKDPAQVEKWWGPGTPYNIGIATGAGSNVVAMDIDPRHGGDVELAKIEVRLRPLPLTWRFLTGGGGQHVLFKHPGVPVSNDNRGKIGTGIDRKGDAGYIVGPGSRHICGRYYSISVDHHPADVGLADMPAWLLELVQKPRAEKVNAALPREWLKLIKQGVAEGRRNDAIARVVGHLLRRGVDYFVALDLVRVWNQARCRPPLSEAELCKTAKSILSKEIARRRGMANG